MIVTTCGAAGALAAFGGAAGFFGDGAGVCAAASAKVDSATANTATKYTKLSFTNFTRLPNTLRC